MKICLFTRSDTVHPNSGGMETQGKLLTEGLVKAGHRVTMITTAHPEGLERALRNGVRIYYLKTTSVGVYSREWWEESVRQFNVLHRSESFDVVLSQSVSGWGYLRAKKQFGVPCVAIMHGTTFRDLKTRWTAVSSPKDFLRFSKELTVRLWRYFFRWLWWFKKFDAIIAVSEAVRGSLIKNYFLNPQKVFTVHNGVEIRKLEAGNLKLETRGKAILYLGRLDKDKGLDKLLEAASNIRLPTSDFRLLIVGSGPEFDYLNNRSKELGLSDAVEFVGQVPYEETPKYYAMADVFVYPSEALEGLPMTVIEAMAAGLPVVASRVGGIPEAVVDGETGRLVEPGNVQELSAALTKLLTDKELRLKMGQRAREIAKEKFSQRKMVGETLRVMTSLLVKQ